ncbi:MAG: hypothetical protein KTQ49_00560 [Candidatus Omnitrophica bacterium]|nr:hypothetical protein [Candidatus Omnitrophota bacterium]
MSIVVILIVGFLLAIRGSQQSFSRQPVPSFFRIWREATDLFLTLGLVASLFAAASSYEEAAALIQRNSFLGVGVTVYLLTRYQKKTDTFFIVATLLAIPGVTVREGPLYALSWAWAASVGVALFQTAFLGLRHKLLFSDVPGPVRGWPLMCLLASFICLLLERVGSYVF